MKTRRVGIPLDDGLSAYIDRWGYKETPAMLQCREYTSTISRSFMQLSPEQAVLLQILVQIMGARNVLEIGTFTGYSSLAMAIVLPEGGRITTLDFSEDYVKSARKFWQAQGVEDRISTMIGDANASLDALLAQGKTGTFDLAFIDADKNDGIDHFDKCLKLLRPGGLIVVDDTLALGRVVDGPKEGDHPAIVDMARDGHPENMHIYNTAGIDMVLLHFSNGMTLARKK